jgi:VCBS repeat-containing protein
MTKLIGTAEHKHSIYDFTTLFNPTKDIVINSTTHNGTFTVTMKDGSLTYVPIQITTFDNSAIAI